MKSVKITKYSRILPELHVALNLLCVGRILMGFSAESTNFDSEDLIELTRIDERIEAITDELQATELLHEAAVLVGDYQEF